MTPPCFVCRALLGWEGPGHAPPGYNIARRLELLARRGFNVHIDYEEADDGCGNVEVIPVYRGDP